LSNSQLGVFYYRRGQFARRTTVPQGHFPHPGQREWVLQPGRAHVVWGRYGQAETLLMTAFRSSLPTREATRSRHFVFPVGPLPRRRAHVRTGGRAKSGPQLYNVRQSRRFLPPRSRDWMQGPSRVPAGHRTSRAAAGTIPITPRFSAAAQFYQAKTRAKGIGPKKHHARPLTRAADATIALKAAVVFELSEPASRCLAALEPLLRSGGPATRLKAIRN
jgi:hypothetical protein